MDFRHMGYRERWPLIKNIFFRSKERELESRDIALALGVENRSTLQNTLRSLVRLGLLKVREEYKKGNPRELYSLGDENEI